MQRDESRYRETVARQRHEQSLRRRGALALLFVRVVDREVADVVGRHAIARLQTLGLVESEGEIARGRIAVNVRVAHVRFGFCAQIRVSLERIARLFSGSGAVFQFHG